MKSFVRMMAAMAPGSLYNRAPTIDEQHEVLSGPIFASACAKISNLFIQHRVQTHFGIALLHRHFSLAPGQVMVHWQDELGRDICRPEKLGQRRIYPCSYHVLDGRFLPFEYSSIRTPEPTMGLFSGLVEVFHEYALENTLAVCYIPSDDTARLETISSDFDGTITTSLSEGLDLLSHEYTITECIFREDANGVNVVPVKACKKLENGGHKRT